MVQPPRSVVAPDAKVAFAIRVDVDDPFPFGARAPASVPGQRRRPDDRRRSRSAACSPSARGCPAGSRRSPASSGSSRCCRSAPSSPRPGRSPRGHAGAVDRPGLRPAVGRGAVAAARPRRRPSRASAPSRRPRRPQPPRRRRPARPRPRTRSGSRASSSRTTASASDPGPAAQRQPLITFKTVGPGDVVLAVTDYQGGDPNTRDPRLPRAGRRRSHLPGHHGPATVTAPNDEAGERSWQAFARPRGRRQRPDAQDSR